jgi:hypothetical protein
MRGYAGMGFLDQVSALAERECIRRAGLDAGRHSADIQALRAPRALSDERPVQYRHPMQRSLSYTVGPSARFVQAPTGQAETQSGSRQCMQW